MYRGGSLKGFGCAAKYRLRDGADTVAWESVVAQVQSACPPVITKGGRAVVVVVMVVVVVVSSTMP